MEPRAFVTIADLDVARGERVAEELSPFVSLVKSLFIRREGV